MTWEELFLSFRVRLSRAPDEYDPVLHGFLALEARDLGCCATASVRWKRTASAIIETGQARYSTNARRIWSRSTPRPEVSPVPGAGYPPRQTGRRFSRKALIPSCASSAAAFVHMTSEA